MIIHGGVSVRAQQLGGDLLANLIKKPWDPVQSSLSQIKMVSENICTCIAALSVSPSVCLVPCQANTLQTAVGI